MQITGAIKRINYFNKNGGFTIALFLLNDESFQLVENITFNKVISIMGNFDKQPQIGEEFTIVGDFFNDKKYGLEFKITSFSRLEVQNEETIINYLSSDIFEGIGKVTAHKIVSKLGKETIQKIIKDSNCLNNLGLSRKQIETIVNGINKDQINQTALLFYLNGGLTIDLASKIINQIGTDIEFIKAYPYYLMDHIEKMGFKKNDAFALNIGIKKESLIRMIALVKYLLKEILYRSGNSYIKYDDLLEKTSSYYRMEDTPFSYENFDKAISDLSKNEQIVVKQNPEKIIFDNYLYKQELKLSVEISKIILNKRGAIDHYSSKIIDNYYEEIKKNLNFELSSKQEEAIKIALTENIIIITGGPGTGKTTIVKEILTLYRLIVGNDKVFEQNVALLAPTGRAAKRLSESSGLPASTIHRYLGYNGANFEYGEDNQKNEKLVIIDEASMMDLPLSYQLLMAVSPNARIIIVGDVDQLPSIGPGQVLKDLIETNKIKVVKLNEIHRQSQGSSIISLAQDVNHGSITSRSLQKSHDFSFIETQPTNLLKNLLFVLNASLQKGYSIQKDIQILIPMYKGEVGIDNVNKVIQELVNPLKEGQKELNYLGKKYRLKDKIIQLVNRPEYGIMNGDIGYIDDFVEGEKEIEGLIAVFDDTKIEIDLDTIDDISLAYAITVHKAQGSEFPIVIMPLTSSQIIMLKRKLVYTAITRAKQKLILLGSEQVLKLASTKIEPPRNTILKDEIVKLTSNVNIKNDDNKNNSSEDEIIFSSDAPIVFFDEPLENGEVGSDLGEEQFFFDEINENKC